MGEPLQSHSEHETKLVLLHQRVWGWQAHEVLDRAKIHLTSDTSATGFFRCRFCSLTDELESLDWRLSCKIC